MILQSKAGPVVVVGCALCAFVMGDPPLVHAQAPAAAEVAMPDVTCATLLTPDEAAAIVGDRYGDPAVDEPRPGFTRCQWQGEDSNFGFTYANAAALADEMTTSEAMLEMDISAVETEGRTREPLDGIGQKAALVSLGDDALLIGVARTDGVARMVLYKVDREKALALARAVATP